MDTLSKLDLSGRGPEVDAALGLSGPASVIVAADGKNASLHISDLVVDASVTVPLLASVEDASISGGTCAFIDALGPPSVETLSIQAQSSLTISGFDGQTNAALERVGSALAYEVRDVWTDNGRVGLNARWAAQLEAARKRCAGTHKKKKNAAPWVLVICVVLVIVVAVVFIGLKVDDALAPTELEEPLLQEPSLRRTSSSSLTIFSRDEGDFYMKVLLPLGLVAPRALVHLVPCCICSNGQARGTPITNFCRFAGGAELLHLR